MPEPSAEQLDKIIKSNTQHVIYWSHRLKITPELWDDAISIGKLQILKDYQSMPYKEFHKKISYNIAKSLGNFLASLQNYKNLENAKFHNFERNNVSYDALLSEDYGFIDALSYNIYKNTEKIDDKWDYIYSKVKPMLRPVDVQLIKLLWRKDNVNGKKKTYKLLRRARRMYRRPREETLLICKLAIEAGFSKSKFEHKILEQTRRNVIIKVAKIIDRLGLADVQISHNIANSELPLLTVIPNKKYV